MVNDFFHDGIVKMMKLQWHDEKEDSLTLAKVLHRSAHSKSFKIPVKNHFPHYH